MSRYFGVLISKAKRFFEDLVDASGHPLSQALGAWQARSVPEFRSPVRDTEGEPDAVSNPSHYFSGTPYEVHDVQEAWGLTSKHYLATAIEYIVRAGNKSSEDELKDLRKARYNLDRHIRRLELGTDEHGVTRAANEPGNTGSLPFTVRGTEAVFSDSDSSSCCSNAGLDRVASVARAEVRRQMGEVS